MDVEFALIQACFYGNKAEVQALLAREDVKSKVNRGPALCAAAHSGDEDVVSILLEHGADARKNASRALRVACWRGNSGAARVLLSAGADPNAKFNQPMRLARESGMDLSCLLAAGAQDPEMDDWFQPVIFHMDAF